MRNHGRLTSSDCKKITVTDSLLIALTELTALQRNLGIYSLTTVTSTILGNGDTVIVNGNGVLVNGSQHTTTSSGLVSHISINGNGVIFEINTATTYTLPTASRSVLGGVKVDGTSITINNGVISAVNTNTNTSSILISNINHTSTEGQTVFSTPSYVIGQNQLAVYIDGVRQYSTEYVETSTTSVTLNQGCSAGDVILVEVTSPSGVGGGSGSGTTGTQGPTGPAGAKGDTGPAGAKGDTGPAGSGGSGGGPTGPQGIPGPTGPAGSGGSGGGTTGPAGAKGDTGTQGLQGIQGPAGAKGDTGTQGLQGIQGPAGAKGDTGSSASLPSTLAYTDRTNTFSQSQSIAGLTVSAPHQVRSDIYGGLTSAQGAAGVGIVDPSNNFYTVGMFSALQNNSYALWLHNATPGTSVAYGKAMVMYLYPSLINSNFVEMVTTHTTLNQAIIPPTSTVQVVITNDGKILANAFTIQGSDYAEYFEWKDLNPNNEDRVGYCVVLDNGMIRKYDATIDNINDIIGTISGTAGVIGNSGELYWSQQFLSDDFGRRIEVEVPMAKWDDSNGELIQMPVEDANIQNITIPPNATLFTITQHKLNPLFDPTRAKEYQSREKRPEWGLVGLFGQVWIRNGQPIKPEWKFLNKSNASASFYFIK